MVRKSSKSRLTHNHLYMLAIIGMVLVVAVVALLTSGKTQNFLLVDEEGNLIGEAAKKYYAPIPIPLPPAEEEAEEITEIVEPIINAHECRADNTCEVNSLAASGGSYIKALKVGLDLRGGPSVLIDEVKSYFIRPASFAGNVTLERGSWLRLSSMSSPSIAGDSGSAYVCVTGNGILYRSNIPCR